MGLTKTEIFTQAQNEVAVIARVLAHPARIAILQHLLKVNQCIGGEVVAEIGLAQPTISRHLKELKDVGLIRGEIDGNRVNYCIDADRWSEVRSVFLDFFNRPVAQLDCS